MRLGKILAVIWLVLVILLSGALALERHSLPQRIDTDLFALLPSDKRNPMAEEALKSLSKQGEQHLVFMLGSKNPKRTLAAAHEFQQYIHKLPLKPQALGETLSSISKFYQPYRRNFLAPADQSNLQNKNIDWAQRALANAYSPMAGATLAWKDDPFNFYANWLQSLGGSNKAHPEDGVLRAESGGVNYVLLPYTLSGSAFSLDLQTQILTGIDSAAAKLKTNYPDVELNRAGVILHAATAAKNARKEMSTIGLGSTLGILLLALLVFRGVRPVALSAMSVLTGSMVSLALTLAWFGHLHILTLVFGTSLVGVAVDYSLLALASGIDNAEPIAKRYRKLMPSMILAVTTTLFGYMGLALTPFPGLAQMAAFATIGILASWLSVMLWFPFLESSNMRSSPISNWIGNGLNYYPRIFSSRWLYLLPLIAFIGFSLPQLKQNDDIRALSGIDPTLLKEQIKIGQVIGLPSPAQLFIVKGNNPQQVLEREEALQQQLAPFIKTGKLTGVASLSRWIPSYKTQQQNFVLFKQRIAAQKGVLESLASNLGLSKQWQQQQASATPMLDFNTWLKSPATVASSYLWLGKHNGDYASMVLLQGLNNRYTANELSKIKLDGITWVDKVADISQLMTQYSHLLTKVLIAAYILASALLALRYKKQTWRIMLPPILATMLSMSVLALLGIPLQLLIMVTFLLVLGMGVDYGIFLLEHPNDSRVFLAVSMAAICTILSFGLLALSHTPALHAFGLSTLCGIGFVWLIAPLFRISSSDSKLN